MNSRQLVDAEKGLESVNAAYAAVKVYGSDHPAFADRAEQASAALTRAASSGGFRVLFLPDRIVIDDRAIESSEPLMRGAFARMGSDLPDCLRVSGPVSVGAVGQLVAHLRKQSEKAGPAIVGPFSLRWLGASEKSGAERTSERTRTPTPRQEVGAGSRNSQTGNALSKAYRASHAQGLPGAGQIDRIATEITLAATGDQQSVLSLASLKNHDEYTYVHAINVGMMASALCTAVGMSPDRTKDVTIGGVLHDVGKCVIPSEIINKAGKLTNAERATVNKHPEEGARMLSQIPGLPAVSISIAYEHHMNLAGGGYPNVPRGWNVGLASQIVHIADVFDALRTHRPYRKALPIEKALEIMSEQAGACFDKALFEVFVEVAAPRLKAS